MKVITPALFGAVLLLSSCGGGDGKNQPLDDVFPDTASLEDVTEVTAHDDSGHELLTDAEDDVGIDLDPVEDLSADNDGDIGEEDLDVLTDLPDGYSDLDLIDITDLDAGSDETSEDQVSDLGLDLETTDITLNCEDSEFACGVIECIDEALLCDGWKDCPEDEDEAPELCATLGCAPGTWQCNDGECLPDFYLCDDFDDCTGGEDEAEATCGVSACPDGMWECPVMGSCIPAVLVCDGNYDCAMGEDEDEALCAGKECPSGTWECDDGTCIEEVALCDGYEDCLTGEDEEEVMCSQIPCPPTKWQCPTGACLFVDMVCDGWPDCADGTDESADTCAGTGCLDGAWACADGACIVDVWRCNGDLECAGGEDEEPGMCAAITCDETFEPSCFQGIYSSCETGFKDTVYCSTLCLQNGFAGFDECGIKEGDDNASCLCLENLDQDACADGGLYNDGQCQSWCPLPDPDC
jgi:hypothetical protein